MKKQSSIDLALKFIEARTAVTNKIHSVFTEHLQETLETFGVTDIQIVLRDRDGNQLSNFTFEKRSHE